ncbi:glycosyltransferase family 2 protein [bacterium]|jgi:glycosyltransferase involved in cell wall biosynthesis|nr:glycosyltransferase family 2 protein [bacterium]MBT5015708.1 glycosyltransferase family 2 protein [bacterium]
MFFFKPIPEKKLVVVVPSYNNAQWYKHNLDSIFNQNYTNYRIIYLDDHSSDNTAHLVEQYIYEKHQQQRVTLIKNETRQGATANRYKGSHLCENNEIILILDGDDWFAHDNVLKKINKVYSKYDIWVTYGQYKRFPSNKKGHCKKLPQDFDFRASTCYYTSALRTYYAWLFKKIPKNDLQHQGEFFQIAGDVAEMLPMVEMARGHIRFIREVLYIYNNQTPLNDFKNNYQEQLDIAQVIRSKPQYPKITNHEL